MSIEKSMATIIQFLHPGGEPNEKSGEPWNTGAHHRKFLKVEGKSVQGLAEAPVAGELGFWGEWEAQSKLVRTLNGTGGMPKYLFEPFYQLPIPAKAANTDPFAFGNQFYYCICKQGHYPSLGILKPKDIILFGSCLNGKFVLDTVFVIKKSRPYTLDGIKNLKKEYNEAFYNASLSPLSITTPVQCKKIVDDGRYQLPNCGDDKRDNKPTTSITNYQIYEAVMYDDKDEFDGMFSFSPACLLNNSSNGFARPNITVKDLSQSLNQGIKLLSSNTVADVWKDIADHVIKKGLLLMVSNNLPLQKS